MTAWWMRTHGAPSAHEGQTQLFIRNVLLRIKLAMTSAHHDQFPMQCNILFDMFSKKIEICLMLLCRLSDFQTHVLLRDLCGHKKC